MGRLIDIDVLFDYFGNDAIDEITRSNIEYFVSEKGTVEAIPKADYEQRLKADMEAMLTDIQLEIEEKYIINPTRPHEDFLTQGMREANKVVQEKINALRGNNNETEKTKKYECV